MKNKKVLLLLGILIVAFFLLFGTLKKSPIDDFPIPIIAQVDTKHSDEQISYQYKGFNSLYVKHVRLFGWKEVDRLGSMGIFEKDGKQVSLTTFKDGFSIATYTN
ncbi:hypothetical protein [Ornithinibacillus scapharcae]|uniref:hypothetical protein n=1 Tax=Ornithinibacillus scapharcae TaxID=1147159 RepID=UPI000225AB6C|nr:hypothetical protein [Ornithinibacillus scapharcae]